MPMNDEDYSRSSVLAERTSQILNDFHDYIAEIGADDNDDDDGLGLGVAVAATDTKENAQENEFSAMMAGIVRNSNKNSLLSTGSSGIQMSPLQREWSYTSNKSIKASSYSYSDDLDKVLEEEKMMGLARGQRYTHHVLQFKWVKLVLLNCVIFAAVIIGASLYFVNEANKSMENMDEEIDEVVGQLATKGEKAPANQGTPTDGSHESNQPSVEKFEPISVENISTTEELFVNNIVEYLPMFYDRHTGWSGKTYFEANQFCKNITSIDGLAGDYGLCSYDAVCPLGPDSFPIFGYHDGTSGRSWVPISDEDNFDNDWVNLDRRNACVRYSAENQYPPEWGIHGGEADDMTSQLLCCISSDYLRSVDPNKITVGQAEGVFTGWNVVATFGVENPNIHTYQELSARFLPLEFDRSRGYDGQTYLEATDLCGALPDGDYELCPYDLLCPLGPETDPIVGIKFDIAGSWAPILGNEWVKLGPEMPCVKYSALNSEPTPSWSDTGFDNEEITRHVLCCLRHGIRR